MGHIDLALKYPYARKMALEVNTICKFYRPVYGFDYQLFTGNHHESSS